MPKALGGAGTESYFSANPYIENEHLRYYMLGVIGFHFGNAIKAALDGEFYRVVVHIPPSIIFSGCYILNLMHVAVVLALIQDSSEIFFKCSQLVSYTKFAPTLLPIVSFASFAAWAYTRLFVLTSDVLLNVLNIIRAGPEEDKSWFFLEDSSDTMKMFLLIAVCFLAFRSISGSITIIKNLTAACNQSDKVKIN